MTKDFVFCLACDYINYVFEDTGNDWLSKPNDEPNVYCLAMRNIGKKFQKRFEGIFDCMREEILVTPPLARHIFNGIFDELFWEGIRWSRIMTLFVFAGHFALNCHKLGMPQLRLEVAEFVEKYVHVCLGVWIKNSGGWAGFLQYCSEYKEPERYETNVYEGCGIGALFKHMTYANYGCLLSSRVSNI